MFAYVWPHGVFDTSHRLPLVAMRGLFTAARRLLTVAASLVAEHRLRGTRASVAAAPRLYRAGIVAVAHGLSCPAAAGIFPTQGLNPCLQLLQADYVALSHLDCGYANKCPYVFEKYMKIF